MADRSARRWLLEAAVIVGSILLAFGLDAWWNERVRIAELESEMLDVRRELVAAIEDTRPVWRYHALRSKLAERVGVALAAAPSEVARVRAGDLTLLLPQSTSDFQTLTVESFLARGGLELFDEEAALALQRWPGVAADLLDDQIRLRATADREMTSLLRASADLRQVTMTGVPALVETGGSSDWVAVDVSRELINLFAWRRAAEAGIAGTILEVCDLATEIINAIDARISSGAIPPSPAPCAEPEMPAWLEATSVN